jgi:hypothetical protein
MASAVLVFAANDDNRRELADRLAIAVQGRYPVLSKTPLGFFQDEVILFWPLLIQRLDLRAQFPLRLRPETEQELATQLWRPELDSDRLQFAGVSEYRLVRRILDLLQLAAVSGIPVEDLPSILEEGMSEQEGTPEQWALMGEMLLKWRKWCLERGFLTYGIICDLYWRELLADSTYLERWRSRYQAVFADDVDDYPAIAKDLFDHLLDRDIVGVFTYNSDGKVRLGLNADPGYLEKLASRCHVETLSGSRFGSLAHTVKDAVIESIGDAPLFLTGLPATVQSLQTTSRAELLRQTAEVLASLVKSGKARPGEIAVIAPGLDAIARYTLTEILTNQGIPVEPLNDQRPLISSPLIRALLTLLALVYPGLGRLVDRDAIAEMLVVLSSKPSSGSQPKLEPAIDPVRAGLLADYCYSPSPEQPRLLSVESFPRWDRLGHRATTAYLEIVQWLEIQRQQQEQRLILNAIALLDRAIQRFLGNAISLPYDQLSALRELMETAQHYWEVDGRLQKSAQNTSLDHSTVAQFIQLLRRGTVTANPYPVRRFAANTNDAITLATIFQYRASRRSHHYHFWLDAGSPLWSSGGAAILFGAPLFLKEWSGRPWTEEDKFQADEERLRRILRDLIGRVSEQIYLCHSELAVNGQEQTGPLLTLVNTAMPLTSGFVSV